MCSSTKSQFNLERRNFISLLKVDILSSFAPNISDILQLEIESIPSYPAIADSRCNGHQTTVQRVSAITRVIVYGVNLDLLKKMCAQWMVNGDLRSKWELGDDDDYASGVLTLSATFLAFYLKIDRSREFIFNQPHISELIYRSEHHAYLEIDLSPRKTSIAPSLKSELLW